MPMTFKQFLAEIMMDVDTSNPQAAMQQVKQAARLGDAKVARIEQQKAKASAEVQDVEGETGGAPSAIDKQITALKQRLAMLQQRKAREQEQQQKQQGM